MKTRVVVIVLALSSLATFCSADGNHIGLRSIDRNQNVRIDADEVQLSQSHTIDTTLILERAANYEYFAESDFPEVIKKTSDSASVVIRIENKMSQPGKYTSGYSVYLIGEIRDERIQKLYLIELGELANYWRLTESVFSIGCDSTSKRVRLNAVLKAVGFQTGSAITFPTVKKVWGRGYDYTIDRYILVETEFTVDEKFMKFFPPFFEP